MQSRTSYLMGFLACAVFVASLFLFTSQASADVCKSDCNLAKRDCYQVARDAAGVCKDGCDGLANPERRDCRRTCQSLYNDAKAGCRVAHGTCRDDCDGTGDDVSAEPGCTEVCGAAKTVCLADARADLVAWRATCDELSNPERRICRRTGQEAFNAAKKDCRNGVDGHKACIDECKAPDSDG